ncbi:MAG: sigma-54-dependent Fis family transcriptional regulator, partial [Siphonobacter sp.]
MILILDDDLVVRTSLLLLMQKEKLPAIAVESPQEAKAFLRQSRPDLVLLDMNFSVDTSGEEGLGLLQWI